MLLKKISFLLFLLIPFLMIAGGQSDPVDKDRIIYDIDNFNAIDGSASFILEVKQSDRFSVVVFAEKSIASKILVEKRGRTLSLGMKPFSGLSWSKSPRAVITMPRLDSVELSGASSMIAAGFRGDGDFSADISGSSSLEIDTTANRADFELSGASELRAVLESPEVYLDISGSSDIELIGLGKNLEADLDGASSGNLKEFKISSASVELSGSSDLAILLNGKLDLDASGASSLNYSGDVILGSIELSGASSMKEK
ncbi:MAG: DUF2807 domain-containing protein [Spirochaetales bacterium]|nr:DUF2807 domain-containing protein [Spirochaetales bacterium]